MRTLTLIPAYGRDYKSKSAVQADFEADRDFQIADVSSAWDGSYTNRPQLVGEYASVTIRYARLRRIAVILVK